MANYVKATDFASKDALVTGNPLKIIKGTEINTEFNAIQTAIATKADLASPAFTGNATATTQTFGNNSSRIATTAFVQEALQALHPVGSIYIAVISTNPGTLFGFGTWVAFATGRTLIGINPADTIMDTAEETGGSKDAVVVSHTHTVSSSGTHSHTTNAPQVNQLIHPEDRVGSEIQPVYFTDRYASTTSGGEHTHNVNASGVSATNANLPPYITVFMWKRTA